MTTTRTIRNLLFVVPVALSGSVAVAQPGPPSNCACPVPGAPVNMSGYSPAPMQRMPPYFEPAPVERPRLRQGEDVRRAQQKLSRLGYDVGTPDGVFGAATDQAIRRFQQENGLAPDGLLGPSTTARLNARAGSSSASSLTIKREQDTEEVKKPSIKATTTDKTDDEPDTAAPAPARKSNAKEAPVALDGVPAATTPKEY